MSWWLKRRRARERLAQVNRLEGAVCAISTTLEQLRDRLDRVEERLNRPEMTEQSAAEQHNGRIEELAVQVSRLERLAGAHLDPTEKRRYLKYLVDLGGLQRTDTVLDIGCGPGRIAKELSGVLSPEGKYIGIEIQAGLVERLRRQYVGRPHFEFFHADIKNTEYNSGGSVSPSEYKFPLSDESVQLVVLRSVFTHMLPLEVENYVREIARVLRPGGRSVITYYLLNEQSRRFVDSQSRPVYAAYPYDGRGSFPHDYGTYRVRYKEMPERAVAYDEETVRSLYVRYGMKIREPIQYGSWSGRIKYLTGQDIVVAEKI